MAHDAGGDVALVGEATTTASKSLRLPRFLSGFAEISISALRTDTGEALSTMQWAEGGLGWTETEAIKEAFSRISPDEIDNFAKALLTKWLIGVAQQEIVRNEVVVGTPPQIEIDSPQEGEIVHTDTIRLQGHMFRVFLRSFPAYQRNHRSTFGIQNHMIPLGAFVQFLLTGTILVFFSP